VKRLGCLPLAIEQVAAVFKKGFIRIEEFESRYVSDFQRLMEYRPQRSLWAYEKNRSIFTTFELLFESINRDSATAAAMLTILSVYGDCKSPVRILESGLCELATGYHKHDSIQHSLHSMTTDQMSIRMAIDYLADTGVVGSTRSKSGAVEAITLHSLLCKWALETADAGRKDWIVLASYLLARYLQNCDDR
jgi:hypothetical protein